MKKFLASLLGLLGCLLILPAQGATAPEWGSRGWVQFPSNDFPPVNDPGVELTSSARLGLTAEGDEVAMTYTPATYEIQRLSTARYAFLQIYDAPLDESGGDDLGSGTAMELVFSGSGAWEVACRNASKEWIKVADPKDPRLSLESTPSSICDIPSGDWSGSFRIHTGSSTTLQFKTVWPGTKEELMFSDKPKHLKDLINVFRFQTRYGIVRLAPTNTEKIGYPDGTLLPWRTHPLKSDYEASINWVVLYKMMKETFYSFEIDVSEIRDDYLYLWDKDADANQLYVEKGKAESKPPDDGIQMLVRWSDGTPLQFDKGSGLMSGGIPITQDPEWTHFNQTNREGFNPVWNESGETNRFDGPSWDSDKDPEGYDSIRWYKIPLKERKSDTIVVGWFGSNMPNNAFAFAASGPVSPAPCRDPEVCEALFEEGAEEPELSEEGCVIQDRLKICLFSTPEEHPNEDSYGLDPNDPEKNVIEYTITVENLSDEEDPFILENPYIAFEPPVFTTVPEELWDQIMTPDGDTYTGKGPGQIALADELLPGESTAIVIPVELDTDTGMTDYDISTEDRFDVGADNVPTVSLPGQVHHVGNGGSFVQVTRCYAFDYFGGDFSCNQSCQNVEPGTKITVRDSLENIGGQSVQDYHYFPEPLSSAFDYEAESVRIDDPLHGLKVPEDGEHFPQGVRIPGPIGPSQERFVYFSYYVPDDILADAPPEGACFPEEEEDFSLPDEQEYTPLEYDPECSIEKESSSEERPLICVSVEPEPKLRVEFSSIPSPMNTVYQGSRITYFISITSTSRQAVEQLEIEPVFPPFTSCIEGSCSGISMSQPGELGYKFGRFEFSYTVKVQETAQGNDLVHPGHRIQFEGVSGNPLEIQTESLSHPLIAAPEPSGDFQHDIQVSRRTVLNAAERNKPRHDQADQTVVEHSFRYKGTKKSPVWPQFQGSRSYWHNVCNGRFPSYEHYDATFNSYTYVYNSQFRNPLLMFDQIRSDDANFQVTTQAPEERPELFVVNGLNDHEDQFNYGFSGSRRDAAGLNGFMKNGGIITSYQLPETTLRGVRDGIGGLVSTDNQVVTPLDVGQITEDLWQYAYVGSRQDRNRCISCGRYSCYRYDAYVPLYRWQIVSSRSIPLQASDQDYVTVLTSVAWLQTKNGHLGIGEPFWNQNPGAGDPNWVYLDDQAVSSSMKFYTPPGQANADLFVYSPQSSDPLSSGLGASGRVEDNLEQGFLEGPNDAQLSRGEAYDRQVNPREYLDDLLNRELFGKVLRLNSSSELPPGFGRDGDQFHMSGQVQLEADRIYYLKGSLTIGDKGFSEVLLDGGKARIVVDGSVQIASNVRYSRQSGDLDQVPSVRLHALENIYVQPQVTDLELMMLAEQEFRSGRSDQQLRILGDVIAYHAFWERSPLRSDRELQEEVNKPSELVVEDFRKYVLTPPGDQKLPDSYQVWRETHP